jgi:hypothetical protein
MCPNAANRPLTIDTHAAESPDSVIADSLGAVDLDSLLKSARSEDRLRVSSAAGKPLSAANRAAHKRGPVANSVSGLLKHNKLLDSDAIRSMLFYLYAAEKVLGDWYARRAGQGCCPSRLLY